MYQNNFISFFSETITISPPEHNSYLQTTYENVYFKLAPENLIYSVFF